VPSGEQGAADCNLATPGAFAASIINGSSFVFGLDGEDHNGNLKAAAGLFSASAGEIVSGELDVAQGGNATVQTTAFAGTYTAPDSATGRFKIALKSAGGIAGFTVYIIDANRMFILDNTSNRGEQAGNMRAQQQSSYSNSTLSGPFVIYTRGAEFTNAGNTPSGYYADVFAGSGDGDGNMTINQSYADNDGVYSAGNSVGGPIAVAFDSVYPGRATYQSANRSSYLYLFSTNNAIEMSVDGKGSVDSGWMEPQLVPLTQNALTDAALTGNALFGELPLLDGGTNASIGEFDPTGGGTINEAVTTAGEGVLSWDQAESVTTAWDATAPGTGTFLVANGAQRGASCAIVNATKFVCIPQTDPSPSVQVVEQ
jgi:hypothetical protein